MRTTLPIFFPGDAIPAGFQFKQRHDLEERAATAARTLHRIYVLNEPKFAHRLREIVDGKCLRVFRLREGMRWMLSIRGLAPRAQFSMHNLETSVVLEVLTP